MLAINRERNKTTRFNTICKSARFKVYKFFLEGMFANEYTGHKNDVHMHHGIKPKSTVKMTLKSSLFVSFLLENKKRRYKIIEVTHQISNKTDN